jgi:succinate dehydrogenase/fumarate reductase flavoprotein subunit
LEVASPISEAHSEAIIAARALCWRGRDKGTGSFPDKERIRAMKERQFSRRGFVQGAALAATGVGALGISACSTPVAEAKAPIGLPETWDYEADIVIVGYGGAGGIAAITAADDGSDVILLEKYPDDTATEIRHTPSSRYAGGICVCARDAKEGSDALYALSFGTTPRAVCDVWGEGATRNVAWWNSMGAEYPEPRWDAGEYPELPGGHTIGVSTVPGGGPRMFQVIRKNVSERSDKITVLWETAGDRLIQNRETNEICGVVGKTADGKTVNVKARKAVALCTGGFEWDEEYKQNFLRGYPSWFYTNPNNTGEGIRMGQAVGGALWHMNSISARAVPYCPDWPKGTGVTLQLPYFIVNRYGKRWFYEREWPSHNAWVEFVNFSSKTAEYQSSPAWIIYDNTSRKPLLRPNSKGFLGDTTDLQYWGPTGLDDLETCVSKRWILRGNTPEELAAEIKKDAENNNRITPEALAETFTRFNHFCSIGEDEDFGREDDLTPLLEPPFFAVKIYPGGPNTQGGLKKDEKGRVLNSFDEPVKRLYCAGENGSVYGFLYPTGGGNICEMTIFGQVIGHEMAKEAAW